MKFEDLKSKFKLLDVELNEDAKDYVKEVHKFLGPIRHDDMYDFSIVKYKNTDNLLWSQHNLKVVMMPIILQNAGINYFLLVGQSRFVFGGKVSLEVNRGFITDKNIPRDLYWQSLLTRKVPYLLDYADIFKVVDLGAFWQHPDYNSFGLPVQAIFAKTKYEMDIPELKKVLKAKHDYLNEPKSGPPLHNTEPILKSFDEINLRLNEITFNAEKTKDEFYLNELFSTTALARTLEYIKLNGLPF